MVAAVFTADRMLAGAFTELQASGVEIFAVVQVVFMGLQAFAAELVQGVMRIAALSGFVLV